MPLPPSRASASVPRFDQVDALRGIAVLLVVMAHTPMLPMLNAVGAYGVQLFFIVSAFTLFLSMAVRTRRETSPILFFFIRRFFRIAPAFYLAAAFYLLKDGLGPSQMAPTGIHAWQIIATLLFLHGWHPFSFNSVVPGGWSIAVEMNFYLVVPLCFIWITSLYRAFALSIVLAFVSVVTNHFAARGFLTSFSHYPSIAYWFARLWFVSQACVFPIGFALFFLCDRTTGRMRDGGRVWIMIAIAAAVTVTLWILHAAQSLLPIALGIGVFAYLVMAWRPILIVNPVIEYIGKISFSVYLLHFCAISLITRFLAPIWQAWNPALGSACFYFTAVVFSCAAAAVTHKLIEEPGQALGRKIVDHIRLRQAQTIKQNP